MNRFSFKFHIYRNIFSLQFCAHGTCNIFEIQTDAIKELSEYTKYFVRVSRIEMAKMTKGTGDGGRKLITRRW